MSRLLPVLLLSVCFAPGTGTQGGRAPAVADPADPLEMVVLAQLLTEPHREELAAAGRVSPAEVRRYYDTHRNDYLDPPRFTARHLVVYVRGNPAFPQRGRSPDRARRRAQQALAALRANKRWEDVVAQYSDEVSPHRPDGLIRDGSFGRFPAAVEKAVRTQVPGGPGEVVRSEFGYHVVEVVDRVLQASPKPFAEVKDVIADRLSMARAGEAAEAFMVPRRRAASLTVTPVTREMGASLDTDAVAPDTPLATVAGQVLRERDFQRFLDHALTPAVKDALRNMGDARPRLLREWLDLVVLSVQARRKGLHQSEEFFRRLGNLQQPQPAMVESPGAGQKSQSMRFWGQVAEVGGSGGI
jgi:hypothetical protein